MLDNLYLFIFVWCGEGNAFNNIILFDQEFVGEKTYKRWQCGN